MANTIGRAVLELVVDDKEYKFALGEAGKTADKTAQSIKGMGQAIDLAVWKELGSAVLGAAKTIGEGIVAMGVHGAEVNDVAESFGTLSAKAGETAATMIGALRAGVVGSLSDFELMKMANSSLGSGLIKSAADMGTLATGARVLAKATGGTTKEAFDILTSAIASGRTAQLKQLGLFVDSKVAVENYAKAHKMASGDLNDAQRAAALADAALAALRQRLQEIPPDAADFGEMIEQAKVKLQNFYDQLSVAIAQNPVLRAGMLALGKAFDESLGTNQAQNISTIARWIGELAIKVVEAARWFVWFGLQASNAFDGMKLAFNVVLSDLFSKLGMVAGGFATMLEQASRVPVLGSMYKEAAVATRGFATDLKNLAGGFAAQATAALDSAAKTNAAMAGVDKALLTVKNAMAAAQGSAVTLGNGGGDGLRKLGGAAEEADRSTAPALKRIADACRKLQEDIILSTMEGNARRLQELEFQKQAELRNAFELTGGVGAVYDGMVTDIGTKYANMSALVSAGSDAIKNKQLQLSQELALMQESGAQREVLALQFKMQAEIAALETLRLTNATAYSAMVEDVTAKYQLMTQAAQGHYATVQQAATAAGFVSRAELEANAAKAAETYQRMLASGLYTEGELDKAREAAAKAEAERDGKLYMGKGELQDMLLSSASSMLRSLFGKSKAAAIAAALIDTYAAVAKTLAAYPWPWSLVPAAAALAAGMAQVNQIKSSKTEGFAEGTPGLDFAGFGSMSIAALHGQEAVIPRGGGHLLAGEIASAMPGDGALLEEMRGLRDDMRTLPRTIARGFRDAMLLSA